MQPAISAVRQIIPHYQYDKWRVAGAFVLLCSPEMGDKPLTNGYGRRFILSAWLRRKRACHVLRAMPPISTASGMLVLPKCAETVFSHHDA
jgi:hypothetical protein